MSTESFDDDFGGFEAAPTINDSSESKPKQELPEWLLNQSNNSISSTSSHFNPEPVNIHINDSNNAETIRKLQNELSETKEHLIDQQTKYLQAQTKHRQEIDDTTTAFNNSIKEFQIIMKQSLAKQRESCMKEFKVLLEQQANEYELKLKQRTREMYLKQEGELNNKIESTLTMFQERMALNYESDLQDMDVKIKKIVSQTIKEENLVEKSKLRQNFDHIEKELKVDMEKYVQNYFKAQSETFKDQIKSGVEQEHLIHKDLINKKLEKLYKSSEEKRRESNLIFNRHLGGLNFFIENAHKQMSILNKAQSDFLKNKDMVEFYGDANSNTNFTTGDSISLFGSVKAKNNSFKLDEEVPDENLLDDLA